MKSFTVLIFILLVLSFVFVSDSFADGKTGFFSVREAKGKWWFVDPQGKPFYSVGVNYCTGVSLDFPPLPVGGSKYKETIEKTEADSELWFKRFRKWNFNTAGSVGGNLNNRMPATPVFRVIQLAQSRKLTKHAKYNFIDVYSDDFKKCADDLAQRIIKPQADNPMILGWFLENERHLPQDEDFQRQYYNVVTETIRKYDKNHIFLGMRHEFPNRSEMDIKIEGEFCDVLSSNYYCLRPNRAMLERMYKLSGRPIMLTEFTFAAKDAGLQNGRSWDDMLVATQADRAKAYEIYVSHAAEMPFVVGTHYFLVRDRLEGTKNNWGLCDFDGKLYFDFVKDMGKINGRLPFIHAGRVKPKRYPKDYPGLEFNVNDFPRTQDVLNFGGDDTWLWQRGYMHYACTPGKGPVEFNRTTDEAWGFREDGFIEYRFTLKKEMKDAWLIFRYVAQMSDKEKITLRMQCNDEDVATFDCVRDDSNLTVPPDWDRGFSLHKISTVTVPLKVDLPAGITSVRFITEKPFKVKRSLKIQGFFMSPGKYKVDPNSYYKIVPADN